MIVTGSLGTICNIRPLNNRHESQSQAEKTNGRLSVSYRLVWTTDVSNCEDVMKTKRLTYLDPATLATGKWYVYRECEISREKSVLAGPFETLLEAEAFMLADEAIPSQYGVFQYRKDD